MSTPNAGVVPPAATGDPARGPALPVRNPYTGEVDYEITPPTPGEAVRGEGLTAVRPRAQDFG